MHWKGRIRRWVSLARDLGADEQALKDGLTDRRKEVLKDKKLMLFKRLLDDARHEDTSLVEQFSTGFDFTGMFQPQAQTSDHVM